MSAQDKREYEALEDDIRHWAYSPWEVTKTRVIQAACWLIVRVRGQEDEICKLKKDLERQVGIVKRLREGTVPKLRAATRRKE